MGNWFKLNGNWGKRDLETRVDGLEVLCSVDIKSILDIGSAEGAVSNWLLENGINATVQCVEARHDFIDTGRELFGNDDFTFLNENVNNFKALQLEDRYDLVMALAIVQKLGKDYQRFFIQDAAAKATKWFVIRTPKIYCESLQIKDIMTASDFTLFHEVEERDDDNQHQGWLGVFRRNEDS